MDEEKLKTTKTVLLIKTAVYAAIIGIIISVIVNIF